MAKIAVEQTYGALTSYTYPSGYDPAELGLGPLIYQFNGGGEDSFVGPSPVAVGRPVEASAAIPGVYPFAVDWSTTKQWVFLADNAAAAATRRVQLYEYDKPTSELTWKGFVTISFPFGGTQGTYTIRGFRMTYDTYSTGTVEVSGTAVTGSGTSWNTARIAGGARIGFGSTDPTQISTWYDISPTTTPGATSITLSTSAGTIGSGTSYVIEELRVILAMTNGTTATNGGLFITKGLNYSTFQVGGTAVAAATSTDNQRFTYWVADASTSTNTNSSGLAIQNKESNTVHYIWVLQGTTTMQLFKFNLRATLTLTSGRNTVYDGSEAYQLKTAASATLTGTATQTNNGRMATTSHGPGSGLPCIYFTTASRVYRTVDVTTITDGTSAHLAENMTEIPPGSVNTFAATGALASIEYAAAIDKFILMSSGAAGVRSYVTEYNNSGAVLNRIFLVDTKQIDQASVDASTARHPALLARAFTVWSEAGILYLAGTGTAATTNILYAIPLSADWEYASITDSVLVTPEFSTPNCSSFSRIYINSLIVAGGDTGTNLGLTPEPFRVYYRTSGISDNSGSWALLSDTRDISGVTAASSIQLKFEFRTIGLTCIPSRLLSATVVYNDLTTDSHYQPSAGNSDKINKRFAWRFSTAFGSSVPTLRVRLYDAVSGSELVDDDTATPTGTFEKSTDGGSNWVAWTNADKGNDTTYLRYTPASLADNIRVRALLTLN